ncbi:Plant self-incompatibility S1 [Arabidopsis thaliana x Arabidopsis arenosa]|uniref:Plant self-incompatibility S1 n=1 Tax=Arabidopsis thaliana x Arabidopsis arenosa TaxID=1240361 RepID=A0A8T1XFQ1_9BRAS|nr:Plant self-incompatibility S1 [Arabidopsis thaliana x Arabidopsis arenosa]
MKKTPKIILLLLMLIITSLTIMITLMLQPQTMLLGEEYDVRVINNFRDNSSLPLVIWCTSPQGDIGGRALQEGDDFEWTVKIDLWSAEYTCTMKWNTKRKRFEAFKVSRDSNRCGSTKKCSWSVREDGFYFSNDEVYWTKDFSWL